MKQAELERILELVNKFKTGFEADAKWLESINVRGISQETSLIPGSVIEQVAKGIEIEKLPDIKPDERNKTLYTEMGRLVVDQDGDGDIDKADQEIQQKKESSFAEPDEYEAPSYTPAISAGMFSAVMSGVVEFANRSIANNNAKLAEIIEQPEVNKNLVLKDNETAETVKVAYNTALTDSYEKLLRDFDSAIKSGDMKLITDRMPDLPPEEAAKMQKYWASLDEQGRADLAAEAFAWTDKCHTESLEDYGKNAEKMKELLEKGNSTTTICLETTCISVTDFEPVSKIMELTRERLPSFEKELAKLGVCLECDEAQPERKEAPYFATDITLDIEKANKAKQNDVELPTAPAATPLTETALSNRTRTDSYIEL